MFVHSADMYPAPASRWVSCRKVLRMGEAKKTLSVALGGLRALEGERGRGTGIHGARATGQAPRGHWPTCFPSYQSGASPSAISHDGVGGFGSRPRLCSTVVALAVPEAGSSSAPLLSPPQRGLPGLARVGPPTLGTPSLTGSLCHCPELLVCHPPLLPATRRP